MKIYSSLFVCYFKKKEYMSGNEPFYLRENMTLRAQEKLVCETNCKGKG
jgi:hypothetical protein